MSQRRKRVPSPVDAAGKVSVVHQTVFWADQPTCSHAYTIKLKLGTFSSSLHCSVVSSVPFVRRVADSNPTPAAT